MYVSIVVLTIILAFFLCFNQIHQENNNLRGTVPTEIAVLTSLTSLNMCKFASSMFTPSVQKASKIESCVRCHYVFKIA